MKVIEKSIERINEKESCQNKKNRNGGSICVIISVNDNIVEITINFILLRKNGSSRRCGLYMRPKYIFCNVEYVYCSIIKVFFLFSSFLLFSISMMIIELRDCVNVIIS